MLISPRQHLLLAVIVVNLSNPAPAQQKTESKSAAEKPDIETVDPFGRPDGAIYDQPARIYLWHDSDGWHVRTTAKTTRAFTGIIRVKDAKIMSCISIGLKNDRQRAGADAWKVNDDRNELQFTFYTGRKSDGFDMEVKGDDGQIEFELKIDSQANPKTIFIGQDRKHPNKNPFTYSANPKAPDNKKKPEETKSNKK
jgi:hypothetical protein